MSNNKALVVGGTSGIGGAISQKLIKLGYEKVYVIGRSAPDFDIDGVEHISFDLLNDNIELLKSYSDVDTFVFTAGIGRMNYFETFSPEEIDAVFKTNTLSVIKLINMFYDKIGRT